MCVSQSDIFKRFCKKVNLETIVGGEEWQQSFLSEGLFNGKSNKEWLERKNQLGGELGVEFTKVQFWH